MKYPGNLKTMALSPEEYRISVVLPVYSETDSLRRVVAWIGEHLGDRLLEFVIVLSPRSSPESKKVCDELASQDHRVRVSLQEVNPGLGNAVRQGLLSTRGSVVLMMDSDGEMDNQTVLHMLQEMAKGKYGMVVASRWLAGGGFKGYSRVKQLLNWGFQQVFRILFRTRLHDLTYGFKLINGELARSIVWEGTLHEIACETTLKPVRMGVSVSEVPSRWTARTQGVTKNAFLRNFRYVGMALRILTRRVTLRDATAVR